MERIPSYALQWGNVYNRGPPPFDYDKSISQNSIFFLVNSSDGSGYYISHEKCDSCKKANRECNREDPKCEYCSRNDSQCLYSFKYDILKNTSNTRMFIDARSSKRPIESLCEPINHQKSLPKKQRDLGSEDAQGRSSNPKETMAFWSNIPIPHKVTQSNSTRRDDRREIELHPVFWSETFIELLGAIPALTCLKNGMTFDGALSPTLLMDKDHWFDGDWDGGLEMYLRTSKIFSSTLDNVEVPGTCNTDDQVLSSMMMSKLQVPQNTENSMDICYENSHTQETQMAQNYKDLCTFPPRLNNPNIAECLALQERPGNWYARASEIKEPPTEPEDVRIYDISSSPLTGLEDPADSSNEEAALPETLQNILPATATHITDVSTNSLEASIDLHMPDDIRRLSDAYENGFPIAIIANVDSPLFPFKLRVSSCRYAVLGYFHILNIKKTVDGLEDQIRKRVAYKRYKVIWSIQLRWTPGGDPELYGSDDNEEDEDEDEYEDESNPWWLTDSEATNARSALPELSQLDKDRLFPPITLGMSIIAKHIARDAFKEEITPAGLISRSWYCSECGKINRMGWLERYACSNCTQQIRKDGDELELMYPIQAIHPEVVRDRMRHIPLFTPNVKCPERISCDWYTHTTGLKWYKYTYPVLATHNHGHEPTEVQDTRRQSLRKKGKGRADAPGAEKPSLVVDFLFPCNWPVLEEDANQIFSQLQSELTMSFQPVKSKPLVGVFTFEVNGYNERKEGQEKWSDAPESVQEARRSLADVAMMFQRTDVTCESISHLSFVSWLGESLHKMNIKAEAEHHPVIFMCLGADLEFIIYNPGETRDQRALKNKKTKRGNDVVQQIADGRNAVTEAGVGIEIWREEEDAAPKKGNTKASKSKENDLLRIKLTHGSFIMFSGSDAEITVVRSDFAILIKGYNGRG